MHPSTADVSWAPAKTENMFREVIYSGPSILAPIPAPRAMSDVAPLRWRSVTQRRPQTPLSAATIQLLSVPVVPAVEDSAVSV